MATQKQPLKATPAPPPPNLAALPASQGKRIGTGGPIAKPDPYAAFNKSIKTQLEGRLSGADSAFNPEVMSMMKQKLHSAVEGKKASSQRSLRSDLVSRGILRGGVGAESFENLEVAALQEYSAGVRDIMIEKAMSDWQDRKEAARDALAWLDSVRSYELGKEQNAIAREQVKATIESARISAGAQMYAADQALKGARAQAGATRYGAQMSYESSRYVSPDTGGTVTYNTPTGPKEMSLAQAGAYFGT
jgi:hypothetical protein